MLHIYYCSRLYLEPHPPTQYITAKIKLIQLQKSEITKFLKYVQNMYVCIYVMLRTIFQIILTCTNEV